MTTQKAKDEKNHGANHHQGNQGRNTESQKNKDTASRKKDTSHENKK
jgi:hypothetical protein